MTSKYDLAMRKQVWEAANRALDENQDIGGRVNGALAGSRHAAPSVVVDPSLESLLCGIQENLRARGVFFVTTRYGCGAFTVTAVTVTAPPRESDDAIGERVDKVIGDVAAGRVSHRKVDDLAEAAARSQRDRKIGTAINRPDKQGPGLFTG